MKVMLAGSTVILIKEINGTVKSSAAVRPSENFLRIECSLDMSRITSESMANGTSDDSL
jgi:hypothetical protein